MIHGQINHTFFIYKACVYYNAGHLSLASGCGQIIKKQDYPTQIVAFGHSIGFQMFDAILKKRQSKFGQTGEEPGWSREEMSEVQPL